MQPIEFTEKQIVRRANRLAPVDGRILPKNGKGAEFRTGFCVACGRRCYPYATCRKHREMGSIRRVLNKLVDEGELIKIEGRRGKKGRTLYKNANYEKPEPFVKTQRKTGRNEPCFCGSGKKYKTCCL